MDNDLAAGAAVAAACAAALAATAAWANMWIGRRQWLVSQTPHLRLTLIRNHEGHIDVYLSNAGPGVALEPAFAIAVREEWTGGWANPSRMFLGPGESIRAKARFTPSDEQEANAVVLCVDAVGVTHLWDVDRNHRALRSRILRRPLPQPLAEEALRVLYSQVDTAALRRVECTTSKDQ